MSSYSGWHDLRYAFRSLRQSPGFSLVAVLILALGIGANTAIFTVVKSVLLDPLPYPEPERLMLVLESNPEAGYPEFSVSPLNFRDFHDRSTSFSAMAASSGTSLALTGNGPPERLRARQVTGEYLQVFATEALLGRTLGPDDDRPDAPPVAVLGHGFWQRRFGGDPQVVGRTLRLDGRATTVVGVMSPHLSPGIDLFVPLALDYAETDRGSHWLGIFARLAPGVTLAQARDELRRITAGLAEEYPESNTGWSAVVDPLHDRMVEDVEPALLLLSAAVGLVLLIACANVANLMLSRIVLRQRDLAIRSALGAGRWQLARRQLLESTLLSLTGGLLGLLLAIRGTAILVALEAGDLPRSEAIGIDTGVLGFTLVLSLATGVLFGLLPALRGSQTNLQLALREGSRSHTGADGHRLRTCLVLAEVAVALVLLIGAGLLLRSFAALLSVDPGFETENAIAVRIALPEAKYPDEETQAVFYRQLFERLEAVPGVERAAGVMPMPLTRSGFILQLFVQGRPRPALNQELASNIRLVSAGYFQTMGIPLHQGRAFSDSDDADSELVAVINRSAAQRFWPEEDPLGQRITFDEPDDEEVDWWRVVGVVGDVHHESLAADTEPEIYLPYLQSPMDSVTLVLRTVANPDSVVTPLRSELAAIDPDLPLYSIRTLEQIVDESMAQPRFSTTLLGLFAALAMLLAVLGVYGLISYSVTQRLREIGVRVALGAERAAILLLVFRQGMAPVLAGSVLGVGLALAGTRLLASQVYQVGPTDPLTFVAVTALLLATSATACLVPAWRATRVQPMVVLRDE